MYKWVYILYLLFIHGWGGGLGENLLQKSNTNFRHTIFLFVPVKRNLWHLILANKTNHNYEGTSWYLRNVD